MSKYSSKEIRLNAPAETVFAKLSDFENLRSLLDRVPADTLPEDKRAMFNGLEITRDSIAIPTPMGAMTLEVTERIAPSTVKMQAKNSPVPVALALHVTPVDASSSDARVDFDVDLPVFLKPMVGPQLQKAADQFGDVLKSISF